MENLDEFYKTRRGTTSPSRFKNPEYKKPEFDPNRRIEIDPELESYLPPLSDEERNELKLSLEAHGYDKSNGSILLWAPDGEPEKYYIADGHNRYKICQENGIRIPTDCFTVLPNISKEQVKARMIKIQIGRRNLTDVQKYECAQKYEELLKSRAKQNQSAGGKGCPISAKVDTAKEAAKAVGIGRTKYVELKAVMESDEKDLKDKLRANEIKTHGAYEELRKRQEEAKGTSDLNEIKKIDQELKEMDKKIQELSTEQTILREKRIELMQKLNIPCSVRYKYLGNKKCEFFIKTKEDEVSLGEFILSFEEENTGKISQWHLLSVPEANREDFIEVWNKARVEMIDKEKKAQEENWDRIRKMIDEAFPRGAGTCGITKKVIAIDEEKKKMYKQFYKILSRYFHPDNQETGDANAMEVLNYLKECLIS